MPECHSCPHYLDPRWKDVPWEQTPCAECELSEEPNHKGRSHISLDAMGTDEADQAMGEVEAVLRNAPTMRRNRMAIDMVVHALGVICRLNSIDREAIFRRMAGDTYSQIAAYIRDVFRVDSMTVQAVHNRVKKLVIREPAIRMLFPDMRIARKAKGKK